MKFSKIVKLLRKKNHITQEQFAKDFNVSKSAIAMYETDQRTPNTEMLEKIAQYFNVSLDYLITGKETDDTFDIFTVPGITQIKTKKLPILGSVACGELRWSDVDIEAKTVYICNSVVQEGGMVIEGKPKTANSQRKLPLDSHLIALLNKVPKTGSFVLGERKTPNQIYVLLRTFYNFAGVPKELRLSPHELRDTCGTLLYKETKDLFHVSRWLGHSDIGITTKIYVHSEFQEEEISLQ